MHAFIQNKNNCSPTQRSDGKLETFESRVFFRLTPTEVFFVPIYGMFRPSLVERCGHSAFSIVDDSPFANGMATNSSSLHALASDNNASLRYDGCCYRDSIDTAVLSLTCLLMSSMPVVVGVCVVAWSRGRV